MLVMISVFKFIFLVQSSRLSPRQVVRLISRGHDLYQAGKVLPHLPLLKKNMDEHKLYIAEFLIRIFAGVLFIFQGYDKLFRIKMNAVINTFMNDASRYRVPRPAVAVISWFSSITEFFGGLFLITGFFTTYSLYALGIDLVLVAFAFSFVEPMWNMKHVFPRFVLVITLLLLPVSNRCLSLDKALQLTGL